MVIARLQTLLTVANPKSKFPRQFWLCLSLVFAAFYGWQVLQQAFSSEYVASDDARQHVFWMQRFLDPELFPNDLIADYFQSVAPVGYSTFYRIFAAFGIEPLLLSKVLPFVLGIVSAGYCFVLCLEIFPVPAAGFMASLLFQQNLWMWDDLASATPRAFLHPIFLAFLYYFVRKSLVPCLLSIALLGGFYPQYVLVATGVCLLSLLTGEQGKVKWCIDRREWQFYLSCLAVSFLVLLTYALKSSDFGPTITVADAKQFPEFLPGGRSIFFTEDWGRYWITGERSGIQPSLDPPLLCAGLLFPLIRKFRGCFSLIQHHESNVLVLLNLTISAFFWFFTAHALLFKLHLPGRYTHHSLRVVLSISAAIVLTNFLNSIFEWVDQKAVSIRSSTEVKSSITPINKRRTEVKIPFLKREFGRSETLHKWRNYRVLSLMLPLLVFAYLIGYPTTLTNYPKTNYEKIGKYPELYQFFETQPKDLQIASLSLEASNIPTFSHRSILAGYEYAIPYHLGYYNQFRDRTFAMIRAQYTPNLTELKKFIQQYDIDFWVIDDRAFSLDYLQTNPWISQYREILAPIKKNLNQKQIPALEGLTRQCTSHRFGNILVVPTTCILEASKVYNFLK
jgi:hypothetical protein